MTEHFGLIRVSGSDNQTRVTIANTVNTPFVKAEMTRHRKCSKLVFVIKSLAALPVYLSPSLGIEWVEAVSLS